MQHRGNGCGSRALRLRATDVPSRFVPDEIPSDVGSIAIAGPWLTPALIPDLNAGEVHVWRVTMPDRMSEQLLDCLDEDEVDKMRRFRNDVDARRFATGRVAVRILLGHYLGRAPRAITFDRTCRYCGENHGKPRIDNEQDLDFNVSGSGQLVLIAVAIKCVIGVDVEATTERARGESDPANAGEWGSTEIAALVLSPHEQHVFGSDELVQVWCCKEAVLKAVGLGLAIEPRCLVIAHHGAGLRVIDAPHDHAELLELSIFPLHVASGYAAALASRPAPDRLHLFAMSADELARGRVST